MKTCNRCLIEKEYSNFYKDKSKKDGLKTICKDCNKDYINLNKEDILERGKNYYQNNKEKISENKKIYREKNKEHFKEYRKNHHIQNIERDKKTSKIWYEKNKDKILNNYKNRLLTDSKFKFIQNLKCNIRNSLTRYGYTKNSKTFDILGIEYEKFKIYIEEQFVEGMTWENYGDWHLDHKTPISWANSEEEALLLCHYKNYQPLWANDNLIKGNRYKT